MMQVTKVWWDGEKLMAEPIDPAMIYQEPAQQEPFDSAPKRMKPFLAMHGIAPHEFNAFHVGFCCGEDFVKEQPAQQQGGLEMVDDEGENQAVRMFLALYGGACGVTSEQMRKHLKMAGFDGAWPEWASNHNGHLTKAGAQLWIRHLFALEQPAPMIRGDIRDGLVDDEPAQRIWVGLVWGELPKDGHDHDFLRGATWAEAKLKEKNT